MDIPVPADSAVNSDNEKIPVTTSVSQPKPPEQSALSKTPEKEPTISKEDEERKKIAELISNKKYFLGIKEKRSSPLLVVGSTGKKTKKAKKKSSKKVEKKDSKSPNKNKQSIQIAVFVVILLGFVLAIDAGLVDIGVNLPLDLIKS